MLLKIIAGLFIAGVAGRLVFPTQWKGLGQWFKRFIDLTLVLLVLAFGGQLLLLALR